LKKRTTGAAIGDIVAIGGADIIAREAIIIAGTIGRGRTTGVTGIGGATTTGDNIFSR
jgi:hypothetical protein